MPQLEGPRVDQSEPDAAVLPVSAARLGRPSGLVWVEGALIPEGKWGLPEAQQTRGSVNRGVEQYRTGLWASGGGWGLRGLKGRL